MNKIYSLFLLIIFTACQEKMNNKNLPPTCKTQEKLLSIHDHNRLDNYYWLNKREDSNVIDYLCTKGKYLSPYFGGLTTPLMVSPVVINKLGYSFFSILS